MNKLSHKYPIFVKHKDRVTNQYAVVHDIKGNLSEEMCTVQKEFAETFVSIHGEEIQSVYFNKRSVTLHPIVVYYERSVQDENNEENLGCLSNVAIMDNRPHNASSVFAIFQHFIPILPKDIPSIRHIHYLTDSPTSQNRNVIITTILLKHKACFTSPLTGCISQRFHVTELAAFQKDVLRRPPREACHSHTLRRRLYQVGPGRYL